MFGGVVALTAGIGFVRVVNAVVQVESGWSPGHLSTHATSTFLYRWLLCRMVTEHVAREGSVTEGLAAQGT